MVGSVLFLALVLRYCGSKNRAQKSHICGLIYWENSLCESNGVPFINGAHCTFHKLNSCSEQPFLGTHADNKKMNISCSHMLNDMNATDLLFSKKVFSDILENWPFYAD